MRRHKGKRHHIVIEYGGSNKRWYVNAFNDDAVPGVGNGHSRWLWLAIRRAEADLLP